MSQSLLALSYKLLESQTRKLLGAQFMTACLSEISCCVVIIGPGFYAGVNIAFGGEGPAIVIQLLALIEC